MAIEVELKARVAAGAPVRERLRALASGEESTYRDTYYDWPDRRLAPRQLRVRIIDSFRCQLTFKGTPMPGVGSPEIETGVASPSAIEAILSSLGLIPIIRYQKQCENYAFEADGRQIVATLVRIPDIDATFVEIETMLPDGADTADARATIHRVLVELGLRDADLEPAYYVDLVAAVRGV